MPTQAVFYRDEKGREPVWDFLRSELTTKALEIVAKQIMELNGLPDDHPPLQFPRSSQIEGGLRELRCHTGKTLYRILYRRSGNLFVLLHAIHKDSRSMPKRDVELAQRRWRAFKDRMDTNRRRGPRAVGRDAP